MKLHHLLHQLRLQVFISLSPHSSNFLTAVVTIIFSLIFLILGIMRTVEFRGVGFGKWRLRIFYAIHTLGCVSFSLGLAVFAVDTHMAFRPLLIALLGTGFCLLAPLQIYLALVRRVLSRNG